MTRPAVNYVPAILLTCVSLLFAVTWNYDRPEAVETACVTTRLSADTTPSVDYRATTGLITSGRATLRSTLPRVRDTAPETHDATRGRVIVVSLPVASSHPGPVPAPSLPLPPAERRLDWFSRLLQNAGQAGSKRPQ